MSEDIPTQIEAIRQAIEALETQQRSLGLDHRASLIALRQRLEEGIRVVQSGTGAVASTDSVAAGERGVAVGGDAIDNLIVTGTIVGNVYTGPPTRDPAEALAIYRRVLVANAHHMSLRGLDRGASDPTGSHQHFDLSQVYVDLQTTTQVSTEGADRKERQWLPRSAETDAHPLSALEAVIAHPRVVLLGDPGSGKSTFLTHLALCLAAHSLAPQAAWLARLAGWPPAEADVIPIMVVLRDFARWLPVRVKHAEPSHLWRFIVSRLKAQNLVFAATALDDRLEQGKAILLLDGLDEITTARQRTFIRDAVAAFTSRYAQCRTVVTCRTLSYQDPAWQLVDFAPFTLAAFSEAQIDRFIAAWYAELARLGSVKPDAVENVTWHLQTAIRRPDLWRLASNPLLLTVMALVHTHRGRLPEARALLYSHSRRRRMLLKINDLSHMAFVNIKSIESTTYAFYATSNGQVLN